MIYLIKWALSLTLLYSLYGLMLRRETLHTLNRAVLVGILVLSAMLPLFPVRLGYETWLSQGFEQLEENLRTVLAAHRVSGHESHSSDILQTQPYSLQHRDAAIAQSPSSNRSIAMLQSEQLSSFPWGLMFLGLYFLGAVVCWLAYLRSLIMVMRLIRRSQCIEERDGVRILLCPELRNSCSWMWWVMLAPEDRPTPEGPVFTHELAHVRLGHSWDKILAEITCRTLWFVPFAWMLREDLSDVHEYEADRTVLQTGIDIQEYNQLLILKAVRPGLQPVVNAFNQSRIKKRITMMYKRKSNKWCAAKALYLLPMGLLSLVAFAKPTGEAVPIRPMKEPTMSLEAESVDDVLKEDSIYDYVDVPAHPNKISDEAWWINWVAQHTITPEEAAKSDSQKGAFLSFVVEKDGSLSNLVILRSSDAALADEIMHSMPPLPGPKPGGWIPAMRQGKPVRQRLVLHILHAGHF